MQKRRERIEQWRAARKAKQDDVTASADETTPASRKWTLEDEEDEEADNDVTAAQNGEPEDVDPLDAYMQVCLTVPFSCFLHQLNGLLHQYHSHVLLLAEMLKSRSQFFPHPKFWSQPHNNYLLCPEH